MRKFIILAIVFLSVLLVSQGQNTTAKYRWTKLSTEYGDLELPFKGTVQSDLIVADFNKDSKDEFIVIEGTDAPSIVMYIHNGGKKWEKYFIEKRKIQAGESSAIADIDKDGDMDFAVGSSESNQIWWWENPYPDYSPSKQWKRNYIKKSGSSLHKDMSFGDFDGDHELELAFWNQGENALYIAERPEKIEKTDDWPLKRIYTYSTDGQMFQKSNGSELTKVGVNFHAGMCTADINLDGIDDIVAGGMWFNYDGAEYRSNEVDKSYISARIAVAQIYEGDRPEIIMAPGEGDGPLVIYNYEKGVWIQTVLQKNLRKAHSLKIIDFDKDGDLDILSAEMRTNEVNDPRIFLLINSGSGVFERLDISSSIDSHNTGVGDIDGDGDYDVVGKPYRWDTPRLDIWLNDGKK